MDNLLDCSTAGQVGDGPSSLLLGLEVSLDENVDERKKTARVDDHLDLLMVASSDVGDGPGTFLTHNKHIHIRYKVEIIYY